MSSPEPIQVGPCDPWTDAEEVADCCGLTLGSDNQAVIEQAVTDASLILYLASGRQFAGLCERTVRPCGQCACWTRPPWTTSCCSLSRVKLGGYPVRQILEVLLDGEVVDPVEYRLDAHQYLTRLADADGRRQHWPGCQRLDLAATEEDTFEVSYVFGQEVPEIGASAASALACQLLLACPEASGAVGECLLPSGAFRVVRQGVTVEIARQVSATFLAAQTGIRAVDTFVQAVNPYRLTGRPSAWSPDVSPYAQTLGP